MASSEIKAGLAPDPEDELVQVELDDARRKRRTGRARIIAIAVSVIVIGAVFVFALPRIADYGDVWDVVQTLSWQWLVALGLAISSTSPPTGRRSSLRCRASRTFGHARHARLDRALGVAPGGAAVGMATSFAMLRAWGFSGRPVGLAVVVRASGTSS